MIEKLKQCYSEYKAVLEKKVTWQPYLDGHELMYWVGVKDALNAVVDLSENSHSGESFAVEMMKLRHGVETEVDKFRKETSHEQH